MIRARTPQAKPREGDGSEKIREQVNKERAKPKEAKDANRRTRARRSLRRTALRIQAAKRQAQKTGEAGLEKLINFFNRNRKEAI